MGFWALVEADDDGGRSKSMEDAGRDGRVGVDMGGEEERRRSWEEREREKGD